MGSRQYDPALGQFMSEDPVIASTGIGQTANRYEYGWEDPVNLYDLEGRNVSSVACAVAHDANVSVGPFHVNPIADVVDNTCGGNPVTMACAVLQTVSPSTGPAMLDSRDSRSQGIRLPSSK